MRTNGDFYLFSTFRDAIPLFQESEKQKGIINVRALINEITKVMVFISRLYQFLSAIEDAKINVFYSHFGINEIRNNFDNMSDENYQKTITRTASWNEQVPVRMDKSGEDIHEFVYIISNSIISDLIRNGIDKEKCSRVSRDFFIRLYGYNSSAGLK